MKQSRRTFLKTSAAGIAGVLGLGGASAAIPVATEVATIVPVAETVAAVAGTKAGLTVPELFAQQTLRKFYGHTFLSEISDAGSPIYTEILDDDFFRGPR